MVEIRISICFYDLINFDFFQCMLPVDCDNVYHWLTGPVVILHWWNQLWIVEKTGQSEAYLGREGNEMR